MRIHRYARLVIIASLLATVWISTSTSTYAGNSGQQVKFTVVGPKNLYPPAILKATVSGFIQDGKTWREFPPYSCQYVGTGFVDACPSSIETKGWWWNGDVTVSFEVLAKVLNRGVQEDRNIKTTCTVRIPKKQWGDWTTITYDTAKGTCSWK